MAERAAAEARRASSHHLPRPAPQAHGPLQGPPAAPPPPYRPPMTAHMQHMPHYRRRRESPPNPEAETVRAHPRVHIRLHPHSPRTPTEQDYEESPGRRPPRPRHTHPRPLLCPRPQARPGTVVAALDPHAALGAAEVGPGGSPPSRAWSIGPARGRWRTAASGRRGGGCRRPHGKPCWPMRSTPWESSPATSPRPRTTRTSSGACGRPSRKRGETASACGTSPKAKPRTHTPPHHPTSVGAPTPATPTTLQEPCAPHNTTRLTPRPAAPPSNPVIQHTTTTGRHARPLPRSHQTNRTPNEANAHDNEHHYAQRRRTRARYRGLLSTLSTTHTSLTSLLRRAPSHATAPPPPPSRRTPPRRPAPSPTRCATASP